MKLTEDLKNSEKSIRNNAACICTDNAAFNPYGSVIKSHDVPSGDDVNGSVFRLNYKGSTLEISDK